jgi:hypothetical protein
MKGSTIMAGLSALVATVAAGIIKPNLNATLTWGNQTRHVPMVAVPIAGKMPQLAFQAYSNHSLMTCLGDCDNAFSPHPIVNSACKLDLCYLAHNITGDGKPVQDG